MSIYLLEVGTEELPYKFIPQAIEQLNNNFKNFLNDNKIKFSDIKVYATPRRLAVIIDGLETKTADEEKLIKGPIKTVAYDESGNLTKAGEGFLRKNNLSKEDLFVQDNYLHAKIILKAASICSGWTRRSPNTPFTTSTTTAITWARSWPSATPTPCATPRPFTTGRRKRGRRISATSSAAPGWAAKSTARWCGRAISAATSLPYATSMPRV